MKKLMLLLMSLVLCLGLAACANTDNTPGTVDDNGTVVNDTNNDGLLNETKDDLQKDMNDINNDKLNDNNDNVTP